MPYNPDFRIILRESSWSTLSNTTVTAVITIITATTVEAHCASLWKRAEYSVIFAEICGGG
jgi:hypothetical protein